MPEEATPACLRSLEETALAAVSYEDALEETPAISLGAVLAWLPVLLLAAAGLWAAGAGKWMVGRWKGGVSDG